MIFHPGKVLDVYFDGKRFLKGRSKKDFSEVHALVEMWDENIFFLKVSPVIAGKIKKDDIVLVDYAPISDKIPIPKQLICKILSISQGNFLWQTFKDKFKKKKKEKSGSKIIGKKENFGSYMG